MQLTGRHHENCGTGWSIIHQLRLLQERGPLQTIALDLSGQQEGRPRTARCLRCAHSHSAREVRPCWRDRRPDIRVCDAAHLQQSGRATRHDTQIQHQMDPPFSPHGPQAGGQEGGQASIALNVLRDGVRSAPLLHHQHGRDCSGRDRSKVDGLRFTGVADKRILTIWTVVTTHHGPTHCGGRHETSGAGPATAREAPLQLQREPLVHGEHVPGADRVAWRLGAKTGVLALGVAVGLCLCPPEGFPDGRAGGYTAELRPADISIQQPWKHIIKQQGTQFFSESPCVETRQCWTCASAPSSVSWRTGFCMLAQREDTSITTKAWGHFSWTFEEAPRRAASAAREQLSKHPPKPSAPIVFTPMRDRMCARIVLFLRTCQASLQPPRSGR